MNHIAIEPNVTVVSNPETRDGNVTPEGSGKATIVIRRVSTEEFERVKQSE